MGYHPGKAFLKPDDYYDFNIFITVREQDMLDEDFPGVYKRINTIENREKGNNLFLFINFVDETPSFNKDRVISDGYIFEYKK